MEPLDQIEAHIVSLALSADGRKQYLAGDVAHRELQPFVSQIKEISSAYISHESGASLASPINSLEAALAYALYYTPINAAKALKLIPLLAPRQGRIRVLDLGSGPGTFALALLASSQVEIELTCIEQSREMRGALEAIVPSFRSKGHLVSLRAFDSLERLANDNQVFDLCVAANVLAELADRQRSDALTTLTSRLSADGELLIIEPGQLAHTRALMRLRDEILTLHSDLTPIFPCTRADLCPMLQASEDDWCHDAIEWRQPRLNRQLDQMLGFNKHRIKYSGFIFQRGGALKPGVRVLTPPTKTRAGTECLVCGSGRYEVVRIPKGLRSLDTRPLEKAKVFERLEALPKVAC